MTTNVINRAAALWDGGEQWDAILGRLRAEGFSKVDCIKATAELLRLPLGEAKRVVHDSQTWSEVRERDEEWHDRLVVELDAGVLGSL